MEIVIKNVICISASRATLDKAMYLLLLLIILPLFTFTMFMVLSCH